MLNSDNVKKIIIAAVAVLLIILLFLLFFHRHPNIKADLENMDPRAIYSPAYGTVKKIIITDEYTHVIIFLSPIDIHRQYYPCDGIITSRVRDNNGKYYLAYELDKSSENDKVITTLNTYYGTIVVKQIAGFLARCIVSYDVEGDNVRAGREMGMIEFGSRVDILIPRFIKILIEKGDRVYGPDTIIGIIDN